MKSTSMIMSDGMNCLIKNLGVVETEIFISNLIREPSDYTEWRKNQFDDLSLEELNAQVVQYSLKNNTTLFHVNDITSPKAVTNNRFWA